MNNKNRENETYVAKDEDGNDITIETNIIPAFSIYNAKEKEWVKDEDVNDVFDEILKQLNAKAEHIIKKEKRKDICENFVLLILILVLILVIVSGILKYI